MNSTWRVRPWLSASRARARCSLGLMRAQVVERGRARARRARPAVSRIVAQPRRSASSTASRAHRRGDRAVLHDRQQPERALRRDGDVVQPGGARLADGVLELDARAVELVRPQRGCARATRARAPGGRRRTRRRARRPRPAARRRPRARSRSRRPGARSTGARARASPGSGAAAPAGRAASAARACSRCAAPASRVADLEGRARQRRGELGVAALALRRQHVDEPADRAALAAHEEVEPVLGDELDREVPVGGRDGVLERLGPHAVRRVPARGAVVQARQLVAQLARGARAQQLREQQVVAEPLAARVDAQDEPVGALQLREDVTARTLSGQRVREIAADAVHDRGPQQEACAAAAAGDRAPRPAGSRRRRDRRPRTP